MSLLSRDWTRPRPTRPEVRADLAWAVLIALACVVSVAVYRSAMAAPPTDHVVESYVLFAVAGLALAARRVAPLTVLVLHAVVFVVVGERMVELAATFTIQMIMFASLYAAWAWSRAPVRLYLVSAAVVVGMFLWLTVVLLAPQELPAGPGEILPRPLAVFLYSVVINLVYFLGAIAWGQSAWMSARRRAAVDDQLATERQLRESEQRRVVQAERVRIARDLHDLVAHHLSGIGVQAAGARRLVDRDAAQSAGRVREVLATVEDTARDGVAQMNQLVRLLREGDGDDDPVRASQPGLEELRALADDGGPPSVEVTEIGSGAVSPTVALNLYRVAQEAVTNARRHAQASAVRVTLRHLDDATEVEIVDDGRGTPRHVGPTSGGYGLAGIRERGGVLGAETEIGDRPDGGFRVRVRVPRTVS